MRKIRELANKFESFSPEQVAAAFGGFVVGTLVTGTVIFTFWLQINSKPDVKVGDCYIRLGDYYKVIKKGEHSLLLEEYAIYSHYYQLKNTVITFKDLKDDSSYRYRKIDCSFIKLPKDRL